MGVLRRKFGSLYCPKAIKGAYGKGKKKPKRKTSTKRSKPVKRRKTTTKLKKTVKIRKTVKKRKPVKKSTTRGFPNPLSGVFNIINPDSISKILQENPDIMEKINSLSGFSNV